MADTEHGAALAAEVVEVDESEETVGREPNVYDIAKRDELSGLGFRVDQSSDGLVALELAGDEILGPADTIDELIRAAREHVQTHGTPLEASGDAEEAFVGESALEDESDENEIGSNDEFSEIERIIGESDTDLDAIDPDELKGAIAFTADGKPLEPGQIEITEEADGQHRLPGTGYIADEALAQAAGQFKADNTAWSEAGKKRKESHAVLTTVAHQKIHLFEPDPENSNAKIYRAGGLVIRLRDQTKEKVEVEEVDPD